MNLLSKQGINLNRKVLADLAMNNPVTFKAIIDKVKPGGTKKVEKATAPETGEKTEAVS